METWLRVRRLVTGAAAGAIAWPVVAILLPHFPEFARFAFAWVLFTAGPGLAASAGLTRCFDRLRRCIVALGVGTAATAVLIDVMGRLHVVQAYPYAALALGGAGLAMWRTPTERPWRWRDVTAAAVLVAIAAGTGAVAFAHRLSVTPRSVQVFGDYDSLDLSYYASITAEATHTIPPMAPYYAGHDLNYAYYPQLVLAMVHRFAAVDVLAMYFRFAWPAELALGALAAFLLVRSLTSANGAFLSVFLILAGGDLSYLAATFLRHDTNEWDYVLWPTNFQAPTMEVLHFNSWTPALPIFFTILFAVAESLRRKSYGWTVVAGLLLGVLFQFKPFACIILMIALGLTIVFSGRDRAGRWPLLATLLAGGASALPFAYRALALYADRRSELRPALFVLPVRMLIKLDLLTTFTNAAARLAPGALQLALVAAFATVPFLVVGIGVRWLGAGRLIDAIRNRPTTDATAWRLLAWTTIAGIGVPFVLVTEPYNDTLQFYQTGLYVAWIFTGVALAGIMERRRIAGCLVAGGLIALTLPSSVHYLDRKWHDNTRRPLVELDRAGVTIAEYLRGCDPETTVVLDDRPLDPSLLPTLSERRVVLSWARYAVGSTDRQHDVEMFYDSAAGDAMAAADVLRRYHVTHVIVRPDRDHVNAGVLARLQPTLPAPGATLYSVPEDLRRP